VRNIARIAAWALAGAAGLSAAAAGAEATRTLQATLSGADSNNFAVENLAGTMRIVRGEEGVVSVVATVHAESDELAAGVRLERVAGDGGAAALRVRYPPGLHTIRYREPHSGRGSWPDLFSYTSVDYDGSHYRIANGHGKQVHADLEVRVPPRVARALYRNLAGLIVAEGLEGGMRFDVESADLDLTKLTGDLDIEGSSGDIRGSQIRGTWKSHFSSGDCRLEDFEGESFAFRSSSGDLKARRLRAGRFESETSSGDVRVEEADVVDYRAESSSGDLLLENEGSRLQEVRAHTSSGDVALRLPSDSAFEAIADQSSGDMSVRFEGGAETRKHDKVVAYRRGNGGVRIRVETSSGDFSLEPARQ